MKMILEQSDIERACSEYVNKHHAVKGQRTNFMRTNLKVTLGVATVQCSFEAIPRPKKKTKSK